MFSAARCGVPEQKRARYCLCSSPETGWLWALVAASRRAFPVLPRFGWIWKRRNPLDISALPFPPVQGGVRVHFIPGVEVRRKTCDSPAWPRCMSQRELVDSPSSCKHQVVGSNPGTSFLGFPRSSPRLLARPRQHHARLVPDALVLTKAPTRP